MPQNRIVKFQCLLRLSALHPAFGGNVAILWQLRHSMSRISFWAARAGKALPYSKVRWLYSSVTSLITIAEVANVPLISAEAAMALNSD
jgi:hypothetical protein